MTGRATRPHVAQERVVLHVPGADLEDVGVLGHDVDLVGLHDLGDDRQAGPLARLGEVAQALDAEALEGVRARPRLERAAAQDRRAGRGHRVGGLEQLVAALDRARPGHHRQRPVADHRVEHPDDRVLGMELARGQLERPADRGDRRDAGQAPEALEEGRPARADLADDGDDRVPVAGVVERGHALGQDLALDAEDLGLAGAGGHHDEHRVAVSSAVARHKTKKQRSGLCFVCPARPVPRGLSDREASCRASKVEVVVHVRARTVSTGALDVNAGGAVSVGRSAMARARIAATISSLASA